MPSALKSRIVIAALIAGVVAIIAAGPGTLLVPSAVRLTEPIVCGEDARIEYRIVRYIRRAPGEFSSQSSLDVSCVAHAGGASRDVNLESMFTLFGIYFVVLFSVVLFWLHARGVRGAPGNPAPM